MNKIKLESFVNNEWFCFVLFVDESNTIKVCYTIADNKGNKKGEMKLAKELFFAFNTLQLIGFLKHLELNQPL